MKSEISAPGSTVGADRKSIVVIGDDPLTIRILRALFRGAEYEIDCLASCELGGVEFTVSLLGAAEQQKQLVLVNMHRDEPNIDIARQLRLQGFGGPIVALTNDVDHRPYLDAGFNDLLRFPIHPLSLIAIVERHL